MVKSLLFSVLMIALFCFGRCCAVDEPQQAIQQSMDDNNENQLDQDSIMAMCNETFRTSMGITYSN